MPRGDARTKNNTNPIPWGDRYRLGSDEESSIVLSPRAPAHPSMVRLVGWMYASQFHPIVATQKRVVFQVINAHAIASESARLIRGLLFSWQIAFVPPLEMKGAFSFFLEVQTIGDLATPRLASKCEVELLGLDDSMLPAKPAPYSEIP